MYCAHYWRRKRVKKLINPGPSTRGWHHLQDVLVCPERYRLRHTAQPWEEEPDKAPFVKGELVHTGLAHLYVRKMLADKFHRDPVDPATYYNSHEAIAVMAIKKAAERSDMWHEYAPLAQEALKHYREEWMPDDQWEVLYVEKELKAKVSDEVRVFSSAGWHMSSRTYLYTQRADLIVRDRDTDKVWIIDHKTTYRISPKTVRRYTLSGQFLGYSMLGRAMWGKKFGGVKLNMVQLTNGFQFSRPRLEPAPATDGRLKNTIIHGERLIADLKEQHGMGHPWPQMFAADTCWGSYGPCPMYDYCQWGEP
jgi:hypothetical protein